MRATSAASSGRATLMVSARSSMDKASRIDLRGASRKLAAAGSSPRRCRRPISAVVGTAGTARTPGRCGVRRGLGAARESADRIRICRGHASSAKQTRRTSGTPFRPSRRRPSVHLRGGIEIGCGQKVTRYVLENSRSSVHLLQISRAGAGDSVLAAQFLTGEGAQGGVRADFARMNASTYGMQV